MSGVRPSWEERERSKINQVEQAIASTPDEGEQLDRIARIRGWYNPSGIENTIVNQYLSGSLDINEVVTQLAEPIEAAYTSGDYGDAYYQNELVARNQRQFCGSAAEEIWGIEQDFPKPAPNSDHPRPTTEGLLGRLWFAILHASRKTLWDDEPQQLKLVHLLQAFKARPDPPLPPNITPAMRQSWIYSPGKLWSVLLLFGADARETWNDSPNGGGGFSAPEVHAWTNTNAFVARVTLFDVFGFWNYGIWALRDVLEARPRAMPTATEGQVIEALLPAAVVWIRIAGRRMCDWIWANDGNKETRYDVGRDLPKGLLPWRGEGTFTRARWRFWREKLAIFAGDGELKEEVRRMAGESVEYMERVEEEVEVGRVQEA